MVGTVRDWVRFPSRLQCVLSRTARSVDDWESGGGERPMYLWRFDDSDHGASHLSFLVFLFKMTL